jgi:hypothetical protein
MDGKLGATRPARPGGTLVELEHHGLSVEEAKKHGVGWPHFLERLGLLAAGSDPGRDPWAI